MFTNTELPVWTTVYSMRLVKMSEKLSGQFLLSALKLVLAKDAKKAPWLTRDKFETTNSETKV